VVAAWTTETAQSSSMLDLALGYLSEEWPVFPVCSPIPGRDICREGHVRDGKPVACKHPGKTPLVRWAELQDRLPTEQEVRSWWRRWPEANAGCATGELSGFVVVDLDGELAMREAERLGYGEGPWAYTGRVGGRHLYFRYRDDAPTIFAQTGGIDFRGQGGYVLLPGSLHHSGNRYRWGDRPGADLPLPPLPAWIDEMAKRPAFSADGGGGGGASLDFEELLESGIPLHTRNQTLWKAACKMRGADWPADQALNMIRQLGEVCQPAVDHAEAEEYVRRAYTAYPPNPPSSTPLVIAPPTPEPVAGGAYLSVHELVASAPTEHIAIVPGLLWADRRHWTYSAPGVGKTLFKVAQWLHIAAGKPFCGRPVVQGPVLVIEEDSSHWVIADYVDMLADLYGIDLDGLPFWLNRQQGVRIVDDAGLEAAWGWVKGAPQKPLILGIDACERVVPSDRFHSKELDPLDRLLQRCTGEHITTDVIDHTRKMPSQKAGESPPDPLDMLYGGRAKSAVCDVMLYLSGSLKTSVYGQWTKVRGQELPNFDVAFDSATGFDLREQRRKPTGSEVEVLRVLNNAFDDERWVSREQLLAAAGLAERTLERALSGLMRDRFVEHDGGGRRKGQRSYRVLATVQEVFR
jgi:hypothetical protein